MAPKREKIWIAFRRKSQTWFKSKGLDIRVTFFGCHTDELIYAQFTLYQTLLEAYQCSETKHRFHNRSKRGQREPKEKGLLKPASSNLDTNNCVRIRALKKKNPTSICLTLGLRTCWGWHPLYLRFFIVTFITSCKIQKVYLSGYKRSVPVVMNFKWCFILQLSRYPSNFRWQTI